MKLKYKWAGIPYKFKACGFDGADCVTLVKLFYEQELGIPFDIMDGVEYTETWAETQPRKIIDFCKVHFNEFKEPSKVGDILLFIFSNIPMHCGIYLCDDRFLHIYQNQTSQISTLNSPYRRHLLGIYRLK